MNPSKPIGRAAWVTFVLALLAALTLPALVTASPVGIVSSWPGEGTASDVVATNNGTLVGGATFAPGLLGQAFQLNGAGAYVNVGNAPSLHVSASDFSVVAWVKLNTLGACSPHPGCDMSIVDKMGSISGPNDDGWRLAKQADSHFWFCFGRGAGVNGCAAGGPTTVRSSTAVVAGSWYHVAAVKAGGAIAIYVNGVQEAATPLGAFTDTHAANLRIGSYVAEPAFLNGLVDDVRLYNRALSAAEILTLVNPPLIPVGLSPSHAVMTPNGAEVYVSNYNSGTVSVISTATNTVIATVPVGPGPGALAVAPDGSRVYVGNDIGSGVKVIDTATKAVTPIGTSGRVRDLALTPDGSKLYLAMETAGLGKIDTSTNTFSPVSALVCPQSVEATPDGQFVYVNYQCGGPGGSSGHDAIGRFDATTGAYLSSITGLANVGQLLTIAPNGARLWANGGNACYPPYDNVGCPVASAGIVNVINTTSNTLAHSIGFAGFAPSVTTFFPDGQHAAVGSYPNLLIFNTSSFKVIESIPIAATGSLAFTPDGARAYAPIPGQNAVAILTLGPANDPPTAAAGGSYTVDEGSAVTLSASGSDSDGDPLSYAWDLDDNGSFEASGQQVTFSAAGRDGPSSQTVVVQVCDNNGACTTDSTFVLIANAPPTINAVSNTGSIDEGSSATIVVHAIDPAGSGDPLNYQFDCDNNGSFELGPQASPNATCAFSDNGAFLVPVQVLDGDGADATDATTVVVTNVAPVMSNLQVAPGAINENDSVTLSGTIADPGSQDSFTLLVDWGDGTAPESHSLAAGATVFSLPHQYLDDNPTGTGADTTTISVMVSDKDGASDSGVTSVMVTNVAPSMNGVMGPTAPVVLGSLVSVTTQVTDVGGEDSHACTFVWDDGQPATTVSASGPSTGTCTATHTYTAAGVYTVQVTVNDDDTGSVTASYDFVVVYDPNAGFVTGGGWITSPAGAYTPDPTLIGKATFGFVSKYQKGATTPIGQTEFQFQVANFSFKSDSYQWLVVSGAKAQYKGTGTINGAPGYGFLLTVTDGQLAGGGGVDKFRIKIWEVDSDTVVYDNILGSSDDIDAANPQVISGGSIVIHKGK